MPQFVDTITSRILRFVLHSAVDLDREQWIYLFCGLILFGYLCMRGATQRI